MSMSELSCDLAGLGIGPFNLSLAALARSIGNISSAFFDRKAEFDWHGELMLPDAMMQTSYLKDLVTAVDPTNPCSFLNYLVQNRRFYAFMNASQSVISRKEFESYCRWVSRQLNNVHFNRDIREINFDGRKFTLRFDDSSVQAKHICIGTGLVPNIPKFAEPYISESCFHPKSPYFKQLNVEQRRVLIIGGGQTGAEIFLNMLRGRWGEASQIRWISRRPNLEPLDESAFVNEYFTPYYVHNFFQLPQCRKSVITSYQKLSGDGITPTYLKEIFQELYRRTYVDPQCCKVEILPDRELHAIEKQGSEYEICIHNRFREQKEKIHGDLIILCTGFKSQIPAFLEPLYAKINFSEQGQFQLDENFRVSWEGPEQNHIYAVNFGRHSHGIAEPQTSLMAWRSATILNDLLGYRYFATTEIVQGFLSL